MLEKVVFLSRPRILFVNHTAAISGPTNSLLMLLRYLPDRFQVAVLLPESGSICRLLDDAGHSYFIIPSLSFRTIPNIWALIHREGFDLVYGNNPGTGARNALLATSLASKPFIWHFRGIKWHWGWRRGLFLRRAAAVVAVSHACAQSLARFYPLDAIDIIYNGVDVSGFKDPNTVNGDHNAEHSYPGLDNLDLISVSHLVRRKGHEYLLAAMAQLANLFPGMRLLIAGDLERDQFYVELIQSTIQNDRLNHRVRLLGLRSDVPRLLADADIFVHTALQDPHPRVIIEAMAAGLPVVAFGVDGVAETVVDGQTGFLVPMGDTDGLVAAISKLVADPPTREKFGQEGRRRVLKHFTAEQTARKVAQVIDRVLASSTGMSVANG